LALFLCQPEITAALRAVRRLVGPPRPEPPAGRPIEDVARALRRLRREVLAPTPGAPFARRTAAAAAYEDLLLEAARALGVEDTLSGLGQGTDREAERLRLEHLLREAGLRLD
jgi:hypothetical protein